MADNDYALGRIVEKVSASKYWADTLIFVIEDDAQDGPDHVDAHRTIAYALGPYIKRGEVISTRYSTINMLRTIEDILHLQPMGLNDSLQPPMTNVFTHERKPWVYHPIVPDILRTTHQPLPPATQSNTLVETDRIKAFLRPAHDAAYWGEQTRGLDFTRSDHADTGRFNRVLWAGLMGEGPPYPVTRSGRDLRSHRRELLAAAAARRRQLSVGDHYEQPLLKESRSSTK